MSKVIVKLLIDTKANKVLFAEAGKDFVDFLFHILSLPMATVVKLLTKGGMVGSLGDLCKSIEALNIDYMQPNVTKDSVLQPVIPVKVPLLLLNSAASTTSKEFYRCSNRRAAGGCNNFTDDVGVICPNCKGTMNTWMNYILPKRSDEKAPSRKDLRRDYYSSDDDDDDDDRGYFIDSKCNVAPPKRSAKTEPSSSAFKVEGYVKGVVTYMVMDNLEIKPLSTISSITLINKFNVKDIASLIDKEVQIGLTEGVALLKASLQTKYVLTTVFLRK